MKSLFYLSFISFIGLSCTIDAASITHSTLSDLPRVKIRVFEKQNDYAHMLQARNLSGKAINFLLALGENAGKVLTKVAEYQEAQEKGAASKQAKAAVESALAAAVAKETVSGIKASELPPLLERKDEPKEKEKKDVAEKEKKESASKISSAERVKAASQNLSLALDIVKNLKTETAIFESLAKYITRKIFTIDYFSEVPRGSTVSFRDKAKDPAQTFVVILERGTELPLWLGTVDKNQNYTFIAKKLPDGSIVGLLPLKGSENEALREEEELSKISERPEKELSKPLEKPTTPEEPSKNAKELLQKMAEEKTTAESKVIEELSKKKTDDATKLSEELAKKASPAS